MSIWRTIIWVVIISILCGFAFADDRAVESEKLAVIARRLNMDSEVLMPDGTRCDLVSDTHAIELEWSDNWMEAPGQAVLYSIWTGKKPAVYLLARGEYKLDVLRCKLVCERLGIKLRVLDLRTLPLLERSSDAN